MLSELDVHGVILGHSERRQLFGETDRVLALKVLAALEAGLVPLLCVGETDAERENGDTERKLRHQVQEGLSKVATERLGEVLIAYEPIWAIGTGKIAEPEQAQDAAAFIRALINGRSPEQAQIARILYGGSVQPTTLRSCSPCPTSMAPLWGEPASMPRPSLRSWPTAN